MKEKHQGGEFIKWDNQGETIEERFANFSRLKVLIDEEAKLDYAEHKGREQGRDTTLKQIILKMIANGSDNEAIQALTDVTLEKIEALRKPR